MSDLAEKIQNTDHDGPKKTLLDMVNDMEGEFERALPDHMSASRFARVALTTLRTTPRLLECSAASVLGGLMQAAQLGIEISDVRGQAYLIPRRNKKLGTVEATFQLGYKGMIDLAGRGGITVDPHEVYSVDEFDFQYGTNAFLNHRPALDKEGKVVAFYAVAFFPQGRYPQFTVMSLRQMEEFRDAFASDSRDSSPWKTNFVAMARKTTVRRLLGYLPLPVEAAQGLAADSRVVLARESKPHELEVSDIEVDDDAE